MLTNSAVQGVLKDTELALQKEKPIWIYIQDLSVFEWLKPAQLSSDKTSLDHCFFMYKKLFKGKTESSKKSSDVQYSVSILDALNSCD